MHPVGTQASVVLLVKALPPETARSSDKTHEAVLIRTPDASHEGLWGQTQSGEPTSAPVQGEHPGEAGGGGSTGSSRRPRRPEDTDRARGDSSLPHGGPRQSMNAWKEPVEGTGKSNPQRSQGPGTVPTGQAGNPQHT